MQLATEVVRFFHIDATPANNRLRTIEDFARSQPGWYETLDLGEVFRICSALEREGYLASALSDGPHPILGRAFVAPDFQERRAAYGEYEFVAHGFYRVREHFQNAIMPVVVEKQNGSPDVGTCFLAGNDRTVVTARHVVENARKIEIKGNNGKPVNLRGLIVPANQSLDVAILSIAQDAMSGLPFLRFDSPAILDEVLCMGYTPIPGFDNVQISETTSIGAALSASRGRIVARAETYIEKQDYLLINSRVKGGNSGGPIINKKGYAVGILVGVPLDSQDTTRVDELGYGIAVPKEAFLPLLPNERGPSPLITSLPFTNLGERGFSTLSATGR